MNNLSIGQLLAIYLYLLMVILITLLNYDHTKKIIQSLVRGITWPLQLLRLFYEQVIKHD